jgi:hypothetical protein
MSILILVLVLLFIVSCAPGQVQNTTGYNPACGKVKVK